MLDIPKGILMPCPVCSSNNIGWYGYRYISLRCNDCGFEMYPSDDFASESEYFKEWNTLDNIDANIESLDKQIEFAQRFADMCADKKAHYNWTKSRLTKARENLSHAG